MRKLLLTKGRIALVDDEDYDQLSRWKWSYSECDKKTKTGYAMREEKIKGKKTKIYMHRYLMGNPEGLHVDHKDRDKLNNQKSNLRIATHAQNQQNSTLNREGMHSKYRGVCFEKRTKSWVASISVNNKSKKIGRFKIEEDAARAYDRECLKLRGEFATLNFPTCVPSVG